jgi:2-oxoglutarate dehydrogenase E2 component (dihydrolipoamide succinyltransferase)
MIDVVVPDEQEGTKAVVRAWLKQVGDAGRVNDPLVELETDKVAQEVPAPGGGRAARDPARQRRRGGAGRGAGADGADGEAGRLRRAKPASIIVEVEPALRRPEPPRPTPSTPPAFARGRTVHPEPASPPP